MNTEKLLNHMTIETKICSECGIEKLLNEFYKHKYCKYGVYPKCKKCQIKQNMKYREEHPKEKTECGRRYRENHREELLEYSKKYYKNHGNEIRQKKNQQSMYENKSCPQYLGVVIGERLCKHLFKDVEVMPVNHSGYDIICNKGEKIDVKTACITLTTIKNIRWKFHIYRNTTADYFICVAFDNRNDLNPLYMWMIPGNEVNNQKSISSTLSKVHKWDKWKRSIEEIQLCCTEMKTKGD